MLVFKGIEKADFEIFYGFKRNLLDSQIIFPADTNYSMLLYESFFSHQNISRSDSVDPRPDCHVLCSLVLICTGRKNVFESHIVSFE